MKNTIVLKGVKKAFRGRNVLDGLDLSIRKNEVVSIIGPSGAGKSTLLRIIAGLEKPNEGNVIVAGRIGMVFQQCFLWPHKTVLENVTEALKNQNLSKREIEAKGELILEDLGLINKASSYPDSLSGGEAQRVAIGRTLATEPEVLLLDEITSALDPLLVRDVLDCLRSLAKERRTIVIVTHQMQFAKEISHRIILLNEGKIVVEGHPWDVLNPESKAAQMFIGMTR